MLQGRGRIARRREGSQEASWASGVASGARPQTNVRADQETHLLDSSPAGWLHPAPHLGKLVSRGSAKNQEKPKCDLRPILKMYTSNCLSPKIRRLLSSAYTGVCQPTGTPKGSACRVIRNFILPWVKGASGLGKTFSAREGNHINPTAIPNHLTGKTWS